MDGLSRDLGAARSAYEENDADRSREAHMALMHARKEKEHKKGGGAVVSSIVFGGLGERGLVAADRAGCSFFSPTLQTAL